MGRARERRVHTGYWWRTRRKETTRRLRCRRKNNINMNLRKIGWGYGPQDRDQRDIANTAVTNKLCKMAEDLGWPSNCWLLLKDSTEAINTKKKNVCNHTFPANIFFFFCGSTAQFWVLAASMKLSVSFRLLDLGQSAGLLGRVISSV
jgi:hypothetical protein